MWTLRMVLHSSLQNCSSSVRLYGDRESRALFKSTFKFFIGLRSGLWLGHSRTFTLLSLNHVCVAFTVRFRSLSCWKIILISSHNLLHLFYPVPLQIYHCLLPPQCFLVGMLCLWWCAVEESPTCLWVNSRWALTSFLQQRFSLCHTPIKLWLSLSVQLLKLSTPSE